MKKKKILFLSVVKIFPPSAGGMIRPATFCKALAELGYDVEIYSFTARKNDYLKLRKSFTHEPFPGVSEFVSTSWLHFLLHKIFKMLKAPPLWSLMLTSMGYCPKILRKKLNEADFVVSEYVFTMAKNRKLSQAPWWFDSHNLEHIREAGQGDSQALCQSRKTYRAAGCL